MRRTAMRSTALLRGLLVTSTLALGGCDLLGLTSFCTLERRMGLQLRVQERSPGVPVVANNLRAIASDGPYSDTVTVNDGMPLERDLHLVPERAGTYEVSVVVDGYTSVGAGWGSRD
jgi:hypothetical protein